MAYLDGTRIGSTDYNFCDPNVAEEFSTSKAYAVGDIVNYEGTYYRFTTAHAAGAWNAAQVSTIKIADELAQVKNAINVLEHDADIAPKGIGADADDVDLDITDEDGNVLMRLADGHIQTKNFNSNSKSDIDIEPTNANSVDLDITDSYGNSILRIANGHIMTKKFNSSDFVASDTNPLALIKEDPGLLSIFLHIGCIGDSLSSGAASSNEGGAVVYHDIPEHSFGQYMARFAGITCYNFSRGGLTTKTWWGSAAYDLCFDGQHKCEAYIIALGVNDAIAQMTVGTSSDIDLSDYTQNADSYYGNYGKIIQKIKELQPKAKIFVMTNPEAAENDGYNSAVRDMATIFDNVYIIDLRLYGRELFMSGQIRACHRNGHYNAVGYKLISKIISTYIDWIVSHNLTEFNQVELIGTDWSWNN